MKNVILATAVGGDGLDRSPAADIANGDFSNGSEGWTQFGGSEGPYDVGFFGGCVRGRRVRHVRWHPELQRLHPGSRLGRRVR